jgi:hypothetical protein
MLDNAWNAGDQLRVLRERTEPPIHATFLRKLACCLLLELMICPTSCQRCTPTLLSPCSGRPTP